MTADELATRIAGFLEGGEARVVGPHRRPGDFGWDIELITPDATFRVHVEEAE